MAECALIVEHEPDDALLLRVLLEREGMHVRAVKDVRTAHARPALLASVSPGVSWWPKPTGVALGWKTLPVEAPAAFYLTLLEPT